MGINRQKIKKWTNMLLGNSSYHVNQDEGKVYSKKEIRGYYNNLTEKVSRFGLAGDTVPTTVVDSGETIYFPIAIFQYGLAAFDLILLNQGDTNELRSKVLSCANWAVENQEENGGWISFAYESPEYPYSSMAQGEAISLLLRAYQLENNEAFLNTAKKAYQFMIIPISDGGTAKYDGKKVYFYECPADPLILNGWIFSIWGIMDYCKYFDDVSAKKILNQTLDTLENDLTKFDIGYWSMYEDGMRICSPFYHKLHIAQLNVMYDLTGKQIYKDYADRFLKYQNNGMNRKRAFIKKAMQKVFKE